MLPIPFASMLFWDSIGTFPQHLFALFSMVYSDASVHLLWIKRWRSFCFWHTGTEVRRLVIRPGAIGDFIVSLPALECLRSRLPRSLDRRPQRPPGPIRRSRTFHLLHRTRPAGYRRAPRRASSTTLARLRFDRLLVWRQSPGVPRDRREPRPPFHFLSRPAPGRATVHATDFYLEQVRTLRAVPSDGIPRIACPAAQPENFAVIHPFSGSPRRIGRSRSSARWRANWSARCRSTGAPAPTIRHLQAPSGSTISTTCLLAGEGAALYRQRFRHHASGGGRRHAGAGALRTDRPGSGRRAVRMSASRASCRERQDLARDFLRVVPNHPMVGAGDDLHASRELSVQPLPVRRRKMAIVIGVR